MFLVHFQGPAGPPRVFTLDFFFDGFPSEGTLKELCRDSEGTPTNSEGNLKEVWRSSERTLKVGGPRKVERSKKGGNPGKRKGESTEKKKGENPRMSF